MRIHTKPRSPLSAIAAAAMLCVMLPGVLDDAPTSDRVIELRHFDIPSDCRDALFQEWYSDLWETYGEGAVVPMKFVPTDEQLARMGLPSREILRTGDFSEPTVVWEDGRMETITLPSDMTTGHRPNHGGGGSGSDSDAVMTYAGTGCLGIRPGSFLLTEQGSLCSLAHVYGDPGNYKISTAGHCTEKAGEGMLAIAALAEDDGILGVVLYEFGRTAQTTGDGGIGNDWALIDIYDHAQDITTPTMCFWGGPIGVYQEEGAVVSADISKSLIPTINVDPDPALAQGIVHYGHGLALGTGGTPRAGADQFWDSRWYAFYGAISPGDSGSGSNTALGEAAGINTHIVLVDPPRIANTMGALMVGTRASHVGTPTDGQIVPYPVPIEGLP